MIFVAKQENFNNIRKELEIPYYFLDTYLLDKKNISPNHFFSLRMNIM